MHAVANDKACMLARRLPGLSAESLLTILQASLDLMDGPGSPPALWSAEEPNLYVLVLVLQSQDGSVIEAESTQVCCLWPTSFDQGCRLLCAAGA